MQGSEILIVIAEISVALVGFSGIVVALRQGSLESWPAHERLRFRNMLELAAYSVLFALLPFLPHYLGASSDMVWRLSSLALGVGLGVYITFTRLVRMKGSIRQRVSSGWMNVYTSGSAIFALLALANTLGQAALPQLGIYIAALGWMLFFSLSLFVRLVLGPQVEDEAAEPPAAQ